VHNARKHANERLPPRLSPREPIDLQQNVDCCAGLSLRTQTLTATFLAVRLVCRCAAVPVPAPGCGHDSALIIIRMVNMFFCKQSVCAITLESSPYESA
jgi:hypothetical protein